MFKFITVRIVLLVVVVGRADVAICRQQMQGIELKEVVSIGNTNSSRFVQVGEIASDSKGNMYVSDQYQYLVKKFNGQGKYIGQCGTRGKQPGEFESGPYKIDCTNDTISVVGVGSSRLQFFTTDLKPAGELKTDGPIVDVCCTHQGQAYIEVIQPPFRFEKTLMLYDKHGSVIVNVPLRGVQKDPVLDMVSMCVDGKDNLVVVYKFINRVLIYDPHQKCIGDFALPTLPERSPMELNSGILTSMPELLFNDVATDTGGNIYILGGYFSVHPNRDIYVVDRSGTLRTTVTLPDESGVLSIDPKGCLYVRGKKRSEVQKYTMKYTGL